jgi:transposase
MSLPPTHTYVVPEQTARVAKAAFPQGTLCLQLYDHLGTILQDHDFTDLFPPRGQPAAAPFRLALVTVLQFAEGLSDRAAAEAVRGRLDWKSLLCRELEEAGFDHAVLCEFRERLLAGSAERRLLEKRLETLRVHKLVKVRGRARTDSTDVVAAIRTMNRLARVVETLRAALNILATVVPAWLQATVPMAWLDRYGVRAEDARFPQQEAERTAYAEMVGGDGYAFFAALSSETAPPWLRELPAVETLRRVWGQNFLPLYEGGARWRDQADLPPGAQDINSPYDPEAHYAKKRAHTWLGYNVHLTETCADDLPHLITNVHTTAAPTGDNDALPAMHTALAEAELLPRTHLVDQGYGEAQRLIESRETYGVDLLGPTPGHHRWQSQQGLGFALASFQIDLEAKQAQCPGRKRSAHWRPGLDHRGNAVVNIVLAKSACSPCPHLRQCTTATGKRRSINVRV